MNKLITVCVLVLGLVLVGGCSNVVGELTGNKTIDAQYEPAKEAPLLVIVESYRNPGSNGVAADEMAVLISTELEDRKVAPIIAPARLIDLRESNPKRFKDLSMATIGRELGAKQILYVNIVQYEIGIQPGSNFMVGRISGLVKMVDAGSGDSLWPLHTDGQPFAFQAPADNQNASLQRKTIRGAADQICRMFYSYGSAEPKGLMQGQ